MRIEQATPADLDALLQVYRQGLHLNEDYVARCLEGGARTVLIARDPQERVLGACVFNRAPTYPMFRRLNIPELQDLSVMPDARRQGIGEALVLCCEDLAREEGFAEIGIGVGLSADYGAAQRLYVRMGYVPDGLGVSYDDTPVRVAEMRPVDDRLCLRLVKPLAAEAK